MAGFDTYVYKALVAANQLTQPIPTFMTRFFPNVNVGYTEYVELDSLTMKARVASFVNPNMASEGTEALSFDRNPFKLPTIQDRQVIKPNDLALADFGVSESTEVQLGERVSRKVTRILEDQRRMISARTGLSAIEVAFNGTLTIKGQGENRMLDFGRPAEMVYTPATSWDAAGADILGDIEKSIQRIVAAGGVPTAIVACSAMVSLMMRNPDVEEVMDNRRSLIASEDFQLIERQSGAFHRGSLFGLDVFAFDGVYKDSLGATQYAVPRDQVLIACEMNGNLLSYGMPPIHYASGSTPGLIGNVIVDGQNFISAAFAERRGVEVEGIQTVAPLQNDESAFLVINATSAPLPTAFDPGVAAKTAKAEKKKAK